MNETALQKRLDAALFLLVANLLLMIGIGLKYATETSVGVLVLMLLIGYGFLRGDGTPMRE
ncbi:hypothetical protein DEQ92_03100 [Haloferax sp. Atlit-6N]|uniref:hypothetical protein n=1 Tax=unclassified Haloferax TaxID=2625095 RepID=UPI000E24206B|nr:MULTISPECIES: hypothetical protein [unclassified Haloferax]RDZ55075.1 hypothetical protein C5C07_06030 [Haloferax sp. Atlit-4N]REA05282.1 hypothetical protein DEQ92_03100 [Haloferax sp. Atlit-6N]